MNRDARRRGVRHRVMASEQIGPPDWPPVVERAALDDAAGGNSGATIERVVLADGRALVLKHLPQSGDWLTRLTAGHDRTRLLWDSGLLARVADTVDHTVVAVLTSDSGDVIAMHDASDHLLRPRTVVPLAQARRLLAGLAALHDEWEGCDLAGLCPAEARYRLFSPAWHAADTGSGNHPAREFILAGWEAFGDLVPVDVAEAVFAVHAQPQALSDPLLVTKPSTLLHGDAKLENLGLDGDRLVAIDWGELTGIGPAEVDVAWFAIQDAWRFDVMPSEIFAAYDQQARRPLDPIALDLASIGALAQFGFKIAGRYRTGDEPTRTRAGQLLGWWVARVRDALPTWSPVVDR